MPETKQSTELLPKRNWVPSKSWISFIQRLLKKVSLKEKFILLAGLTLPGVGRITNIGSFGVAVKAINMATQENLSTNQVYLIAGLVVGVFVLAGAIRTAAGKIELAIDGIARKIVRGIVADQLVALQNASEEVRDEQLGRFLKGERQFVKNTTGLLSDLISFVSQILVVVLLMALISWISLAVAGVLVGGLVVILVMMRMRIQGPIRNDKKAGKKAKNELSSIREKIAKGSGDSEKMVEKYLQNKADRLEKQKEKSKRKRRGKITIVSGISSALAMATALFIAAQGGFSDLDHTWLIVMILALRLASGQGRSAMEKWSSLLSEREALGQLRRMVEAGRDRVVPLTEGIEEIERDEESGDGDDQ